MNMSKFYYFYLIISLSGLALEIEELVYHDNTIPNQIKQYAECYENAYTDVKDDFINTTHVKGLFNILQQGLFPYLRDHIRSNTIITKDKTIADKDLYIKYLNELYKAAIAIEEDQNLHMINFGRINILATLIAQMYSGYNYTDRIKSNIDPYLTNEILWEDRDYHYMNTKTTGFKAFLAQGSDAIKAYIITELNKEPYSKVFSLPQEGYYALAAIYSHKPIGYKTFIDAFFKYKFPLMPVQVRADKLPQNYEDHINEKFTNKEVHYAALKHLIYAFAAHDMGHTENYRITEKTIKRIYDYNSDSETEDSNSNNHIVNLLRPIYLNSNNNKLKFAGLFYLLYNFKIGQSYYDNRNILTLLKEDISRIKSLIYSNLEDRNSYAYKISKRDDEYMLHYANYLPLITISHNNKKLLPLAQDGQNTVALHKFTEDRIEAINIDDGSILYIDYSYDEHNNLKLAQPWQLITTQARKHLQDISDKRQSYMKKVLSDAFSKFWDDFFELAKKSLE